jgi:hypothetical protein
MDENDGDDDDEWMNEWMNEFYPLLNENGNVWNESLSMNK